MWCRSIHHVADFLVSRNIAYNFFLTRGSTLEEDVDQSLTVRAFLFPRKSVFGKKADTPETVDVFNIAVCELAGHLPTYIASKFYEITEEFINDRIQQQMLSDDVFTSLLDDVRQLFVSDSSDVPRVAANCSDAS
jgi:GDP-D-glucose phosphorylase